MLKAYTKATVTVVGSTVTTRQKKRCLANNKNALPVACPCKLAIIQQWRLTGITGSCTSREYFPFISKGVQDQRRKKKIKKWLPLAENSTISKTSKNKAVILSFLNFFLFFSSCFFCFFFLFCSSDVPVVVGGEPRPTKTGHTSP